MHTRVPHLIFHPRMMLMYDITVYNIIIKENIYVTV